MSPVDPEDAQTARSYGAKYFKLSALEPGSEVRIKVMDLNKRLGTKWPLKGKDYSYHATLEDGRIWDINSWPTLAQVQRAIEVDGKMSPTELVVRRKQSYKTKESPYEIVKA